MPRAGFGAQAPITVRSGVGVMGQERRGGSGLAEDAGGVHGGVAEATPPAVRLNGYSIGAFGHAAETQ